MTYVSYSDSGSPGEKTGIHQKSDCEHKLFDPTDTAWPKALGILQAEDTKGSKLLSQDEY